MAAPVIAVAIEPKIGRTFWSSFSQIVETMNYGTAISQAKLKFQGDVRGARFYRNGVEIEPLRGGHAPQAVLIENRWVQLKDVADMGYYVLPPEAFAPDSAGTPPRVVIAIQDLKNPGSLSGTEIADGASARAWNDFLPYFEVTRPGVPFRVADARKKSPKITMTCDAKTGTCEPKQ